MPSALRNLHGKSHHALNREEPKPADVASLDGPAWLTGNAREIWDALAPELHRLGLLTLVDVPAFAGACRWWSIYLQADRAIKRHGITATMKTSGRQAPAPAVQIALQAFDAAMKVFTKFGLTPSDRAHLHAPQPKGVTAGESPEAPKDPHDELARRRAARGA
jgi:P27 family predicted phage terminase small subunit